MNARVVAIIISTLLVAITSTRAHQAAAQRASGGLGLAYDAETRTVTWEDHDDEAAYEVSGFAVYWHAWRCGTADFSENVEFSQELPANTTTFVLPSQDWRAGSLLKGTAVTVKALDRDGEVLAQDGFGLTVDGAFCPEELAAAGAGYRRPGSSPFLLGLTTLLAIGIALIVGGRALAHRRV